MTKDEAIQHIENLYPADSPYQDTSEIGKDLLIEAIGEYWRELPDNILIKYAELCLTKEGEYR